jgi:hypothetical protein
MIAAMNRHPEITVRRGQAEGGDRRHGMGCYEGKVGREEHKVKIPTS